MQKLGSIICDICRIVIGSALKQIPARISKKGHKIHLCSLECLEKDALTFSIDRYNIKKDD